jgi:hypothetical protein
VAKTTVKLEKAEVPKAVGHIAGQIIRRIPLKEQEVFLFAVDKKMNNKLTPKATGKTDASGRYKFADLEPGDYLVRSVKKDDVKTWAEKGATVTVGKTEKVDIELVFKGAPPPEIKP